MSGDFELNCVKPKYSFNMEICVVERTSYVIRQSKRACSKISIHH